MKEFDLAGFAAFVVEELVDNVELARAEALEIGARAIRAEAKRVIGTYDYGWPQLAPATQADREKAGYAANEPLLRSGKLRDSIHVTIIEPGKLAEIGSNEDIAVYQELGTATIPPRPFLSTSAARIEKPIRKMIRETVGAAVEGRNVTVEIIKIAAETLKDLAEDAHEFVEGDEDQHHGR
jgi:hypothetical protein